MSHQNTRRNIRDRAVGSGIRHAILIERVRPQLNEALDAYCDLGVVGAIERDRERRGQITTPVFDVLIVL